MKKVLTDCIFSENGSVVETIAKAFSFAGATVVDGTVNNQQRTFVSIPYSDKDYEDGRRVDHADKEYVRILNQISECCNVKCSPVFPLDLVTVEGVDLEDRKVFVLESSSASALEMK